MLPRGGRVLHVLGRMSNQSARLRTEGFDEILRDSPSIEVVARLDGDWSADAARQAVSRWLSMVGARRRWPDAIVCQNDAMANGVAQGLRALESELGEPALSRLPVVGLDGLLSVGQALVDSGTLVATTVLPFTSDAALEAAALYIDTGELPPASIVLSPSAYPPPLVLRSSYPPPPSSRPRSVPPSTRRTH
jgi:ABC-type sugar transport system substrate-binding protein